LAESLGDETTDLKRWQTDKMSAQLRPTLAYLSRLQARMEKRGFTADDKLYQPVCKTQGAMQELVMELQGECELPIDSSATWGSSATLC